MKKAELIEKICKLIEVARQMADQGRFGYWRNAGHATACYLNDCRKVLSRKGRGVKESFLVYELEIRLEALECYLAYMIELDHEAALEDHVKWCEEAKKKAEFDDYNYHMFGNEVRATSPDLTDLEETKSAVKTIIFVLNERNGEAWSIEKALVSSVKAISMAAAESVLSDPKGSIQDIKVQSDDADMADYVSAQIGRQIDGKRQALVGSAAWIKDPESIWFDHRGLIVAWDGDHFHIRINGVDPIFDRDQFEVDPYPVDPDEKLVLEALEEEPDPDEIEACPACHGSGDEPFNGHSYRNCFTCNGSGLLPAPATHDHGPDLEGFGSKMKVRILSAFQEAIRDPWVLKSGVQCFQLRRTGSWDVTHDPRIPSALLADRQNSKRHILGRFFLKDGLWYNLDTVHAEALIDLENCRKRDEYVAMIERLENDLKKTRSPEWSDHLKKVLKQHRERLEKFDREHSGPDPEPLDDHLDYEEKSMRVYMIKRDQALKIKSLDGQPAEKLTEFLTELYKNGDMAILENADPKVDITLLIKRYEDAGWVAAYPE